MRFKRAVVVFFLHLIFFYSNTNAQDNLYTSYTTAAGRAKLYDNLLKNSITKNLSLPLKEATEENWEQAFSALQLLEYKSPWVDAKVSAAFDSIDQRGLHFQKALMELCYANYEKDFSQQATHILNTATDQKLFSLAAEYILRLAHDSNTCDLLLDMVNTKFLPALSNDGAVIMLQQKIAQYRHPFPSVMPQDILLQLLDKKFLPGQIVMYSFQRKNRDYPGLVLVRNRDGFFIKDSSGKIFSVPQLARSLNNLPCYLSNGNTPQGIFKMKGFGVSRGYFIGPTPNVQLSLPVEEKLAVFLNDSSITDTLWQIEDYKKLLPEKLKNYQLLYQAYYAGTTGRTEIIAHGTTINPEYYRAKPWYPHTPSQGCLCTKEIWNGKRMQSDQQKLVYALLAAGGAYGYCVVAELDDKQTPVSLEEILPLIKSLAIRR